MLISIFFLLALLAVASLAAPGLAPFGMLLLFLLFAVAGWWLGLVVTTGRGPSDALTRVRRHQLLRPGRPRRAVRRSGV